MKVLLGLLFFAAFGVKITAAWIEIRREHYFHDANNSSTQDRRLQLERNKV